jgi:hypothetical protein
MLILGVAAPRVPASCQTQPTGSDASAPKPPQHGVSKSEDERFWLCGRYDTKRVIVYFDAVQFNGTLPADAPMLADAVAGGFYTPVKLPSSYVAQIQKGHDEREHFSLGDKYDLLLDEGKVAAATLTTLVGAETDEQVGNDSFIGALATFDDKDDEMYFSKGYCVVRRHQGGEPKIPKIQKVYPGLEREPVQFDIETKIVDLLTRSLKKAAVEKERTSTESVSPVVEVQAFRLANGSLRYYARAAWNTGDDSGMKTISALGAWISPMPALHILAVQERTSPYDGIESVLPRLLNVVDLGSGKTGLIVSIEGQDSSSTDLVEYQDGQDLKSMLILQSIGAGE